MRSNASVAVLLLAALAALAAACQARPRTLPAGSYTVSRTQLIATGVGSEAKIREVMPGWLQAPDSGEAEFTLRLDAAGHGVVVDAAGCELPVRTDGAITGAGPATCASENATFAGLAGRSYASFRLDPASGEWAAALTNEMRTSLGPTTSRGVSEGVVIKTPAIRGTRRTGLAARRVRYEGTYTTLAVTKSGACAERGSDWANSGYLRMGEEKGGVARVREEGLGCVIAARRNGARYDGGAQACTFDGAVSAKDVGVLERRFETYTIDLEKKRFDATGRVRFRVDEAIVSECFEIKATLENAASLAQNTGHSG